MTATQHARGRIEYYSPRGKPSLRVTSGIPRSVNFASAKRFWIFRRHFGPGDVSFQWNFMISKFSFFSIFFNIEKSKSQNWTLINFLQPRALYDINEGQNWFLKNHDFFKIFQPTDHGPKPWATSNFSLSLWIELSFCMDQGMIPD